MRIPRYHEPKQACRPTDPGRQASSFHRGRRRPRSIAVAALTSVVLVGGAAPALAQQTQPSWPPEGTGGSVTVFVPDVDGFRQDRPTGAEWPVGPGEPAEKEKPAESGESVEPVEPVESAVLATPDVDEPRQGGYGEPTWPAEAEGSERPGKGEGSVEPAEPVAQDVDDSEPEEEDGLPSATIEKAISAAESKKGTPYRWGGTGPNGFDCSGLVQWSYKQAGVSLPRVAHDQVKAGTRISYSEARRGDLLYWTRNGKPAHHVAIYLGDGRMIDAPRTGDHVRERAVTRQNLAGAVRL